MEPKFRGYSFKDAYEVFKIFINTFHEEMKFFNQKIYDLKKGPIVSNMVQDEWEVIKNYSQYTEFSPLSNTFKGKLCANVTCQQCFTKFLCEEDFHGLQISIIKNNERVTNQRLKTTSYRKWF